MSEASKRKNCNERVSSMNTDDFIKQLKNHFPSRYDIYDSNIGTDMTVNTRIVIDDEGWIWLRASEALKRVKTNINVKDVVEFRKDDYYTSLEDIGMICFYVLTSTYDGLEFRIEKGLAGPYLNIDYIEDGELQGDAVDHF